MVAIGFRYAAQVGAGGEHERQSALGQNLGHRRDRLTVQVDVEDRDVELRLLRQRDGLVERAGFRRHGVAEVRKHAVEQHANHRLVLDDKDPPAHGGFRL